MAAQNVLEFHTNFLFKLSIRTLIQDHGTLNTLQGCVSLTMQITCFKTYQFKNVNHDTRKS